MPKKLADFIKGQLTKAGVKTDIEAVKGFLESEGIANVEVPDEVFAPIESSFITLTDAKGNHPDIKNHYSKQALDTVDIKLADVMVDNQFTDAEKAEVLAERSTYARPALIAAIIKRREQAEGAKGKPQIESLNATITDLNAQIKAEKLKREQAESAANQTRKDLHIQYELDTMLSGYKTVYDTLPAKAKAATIRTLIKDELTSLGAAWDLDETEQLLLKKSDGSDVFDTSNNTKILPKGLVERVLANNKILQIAKSDDTPPAPPVPPTGKGSGYKAAMAQSLKDAGVATS